jgi:hypothetical protein
MLLVLTAIIIFCFFIYCFFFTDEGSKKKRKRCLYFRIWIIVCDEKEAHLARSFAISLCGITTHTLSFLSYDNSFFSFSLFFLSLCLAVFQTTNHNNNRRPTAQMIESDDDEKNRRRQHHHNRSTTNTTTRLQRREKRRETSTNTKLSNQQFKQAPLLSP